MPRPTVNSQMTTSQVARQFGMSTSKLKMWIEHGAFPLPSSIDRNGVRYFDQEWLREAREILESKGMIRTVPDFDPEWLGKAREILESEGMIHTVPAGAIS